MQLGGPTPASDTPINVSLTCSKCMREMRLYNLDSRKDQRDLYTLQCTNCGTLEVRQLRSKQPQSRV